MPRKPLELTTRDLGVRVEEMTYRHEYRVFAVDGLPNGMDAIIIESDGMFTTHLLGVVTEVKTTLPRHYSIAAALDELCSGLADAML